MAWAARVGLTRRDQGASTESCSWLYTEVGATPSSAVTPTRPEGSGGVGQSAALPLLEREPTRPLRSRRLAAHPTASGTRRMPFNTSLLACHAS
jgi:hypothetical protein